MNGGLNHEGSTNGAFLDYSENRVIKDTIYRIDMSWNASDPEIS